MEKITIEIDAKWRRLVHSPLYYVVAALQGVAITFAPPLLYWSGKGSFFPGSEWFVAPTCFAMILFVPLFYYRLGAAVVKELRKPSPPLAHD